MFKNFNYYDLSNICRTCLNNNNDLTPIQDNIIIIEVLQNITKLNQKNNETESLLPLPNKICRKCSEKIHEMHNFLLQCRQTEAAIKDCFNKITIKEEITIVEESIKIESDEEPNRITEVYIKMETNEEITDAAVEAEARKTKTEYKCDICNKSFSRLNHLSQHKKVHDQARTYKCDICCKTFSDSNHLMIHKKNHLQDRPHECKVCLKVFRMLENLNVHMRVHTNDKPYKCDVCFKEFHQECALSYHKKIHPGLKSLPTKL